MNVSNYNLIHSASLLFCNTFLVYLSISHIILKNKQKKQNLNQSQTLHTTQCILYLDKKKEKKRKRKYDNLNCN